MSLFLCLFSQYILLWRYCQKKSFQKLGLRKKYLKRGDGHVGGGECRRRGFRTICRLNWPENSVKNLLVKVSAVFKLGFRVNEFHYLCQLCSYHDIK